MLILRAAERHRIAALLADGAQAPDAAALRPVLTAGMHGLVGADSVVFGEVRPADGGLLAFHDATGVVDEARARAFSRHAAEHPLIRRHARTGDPGPLRLSDHIGLAELERLPFYHVLLRPLGLRRQACVALPARPANVAGIAFSRAAPDFSDRELALLAALRPDLVRLMRLAELRGQLRASLDALDAGAPRNAPLTPREDEVLRRVAAGATNWQVAVALSISPRTVEKHLEHVYAKLGVSGRMAACAQRRAPERARRQAWEGDVLSGS